MKPKRTTIIRLDQFRCSISKRESTHYKVERFTVNEGEAKIFNIRQLMRGIGHRGIAPGTYTRLMKKNCKSIEEPIIMSDTPAEIRDHHEFVTLAKGHVLINGLGLGWVVDACLFKTAQQPLPWHYLSPREKRNILRRKPKPIVEHVTVIEIDPEIIELIGTFYLKKYPGRLTIIQADALKYTPPKGAHYDAVWHDIWQTMSDDNLEQMKTLHRKYGRRADWQASWGRWECEQLKSGRL